MKKQLYLTIDVEPDCPPYLNTYQGIELGMERLFALFTELNIVATFFCTGDVALRYPHIIKKIPELSHGLGCHSHQHLKFNHVDYATAKQDITEATKILSEFAPITSFRSPYLNFPVQYLKILCELGYQIDSSAAKYKSGYKKYMEAAKHYPIQCIPASCTSSLLRIPKWLRLPILSSLQDPVVLFIHPWEFVDFRKSNLRLDCRFRTGDMALACLKENILFFQKKNFKFNLLV